MVWARFDDVYSEHPKVWPLSDGAYRLHSSMVVHSSKFLLDGLLDRTRLPSLVPKYRPAQLSELVERGLVHLDGHDCSDPRCVQPSPSEVVIHGYLDCNPSREKVEADRAAAAERQSRRRSQRSHGVTHGGGSASPTRPDPTPKGVGSVNGFTSDGESPPLAEGDGDIEEGEQIEPTDLAARARAARAGLKTVNEGAA